MASVAGLVAVQWCGRLQVADRTASFNISFLIQAFHDFFVAHHFILFLDNFALRYSCAIK
jgi:hypothetical protein